MDTTPLLDAADHSLRHAAPPHKRPVRFGGTAITFEDLCELPAVPPRLFGVLYHNCTVYVLGYFGDILDARGPGIPWPQNDPEIQ